MSSTQQPPGQVVPLPVADPGRRRTGVDRGRTLALVAGAALAGVYAVSPLFGAFYDFADWAPLALATLVVLIATLLMRVPRLPIAGALAVAGLAALTAWAALSVTWAESQENAWREVGRLGLYAATLGLALTLVDRPRYGRAALLTLYAALAVPLLYISLRLVAGSGGSLFIDHRLGDPVGYVNGEAGAMLMAFWCFAAVAERARSAWLTGLSAALAIIAAELLVLTQARAVVPGMLVSVLLVLLVVPGRLRRGVLLALVGAAVATALPALLDVFSHAPGTLSLPPDEGSLQTAGLLVFATALTGGGLWAPARLLVERRPPARGARVALATALVVTPIALAGIAVASVDDPIGNVREQWRDFKSLRIDMDVDNRFVSGGGYRYDLWRIAWNEFSDDPLLGVGAGNYPTEFNLQRRSPQFIRQPHSIELQVLSELGLPGFAMLLAFVAGAAWAGWRARASRHRAMVVAGIGMFTAWFVHTSVDWLHLLPGVTGLALIAIALLVAARAAPDGAPAASGRIRGAGLVGVLAACALLAAGVGRLYAAERYRQSAADSLASDPQTALDRASQAIAIDGDLLEAYYVSAAARARLGDYPGARAALLQAAAREPRNYVPYVLLGDLATRRGDQAAARQAYATAARLNPFDARRAQ